MAFPLKHSNYKQHACCAPLLLETILYLRQHNFETFLTITMSTISPAPFPLRREVRCLYYCCNRPSLTFPCIWSLLRHLSTVNEHFHSAIYAWLSYECSPAQLHLQTQSSAKAVHQALALFRASSIVEHLLPLQLLVLPPAPQEQLLLDFHPAERCKHHYLCLKVRHSVLPSERLCPLSFYVTSLGP